MIGSLLPADVYSRFLRQEGREVLFICATDEHGTPAEVAALKAGQDIEEFTKEQFEIQKSIYERFNLSFDYFGRSSAAWNHKLTTEIFQALDSNGFIEERVISQLFSPAEARFLPDRFVEGECPNCGYGNARGDQCENCTKLLDATDLVNPRSAVTGDTALEVRETKHLYLKLSAMQDDVATWVDKLSLIHI